MKTKVVHFKVNSFDVYIGRGKGGQIPMEIGKYGWLGNPFPIGMEFDTPIGKVPIGRTISIAMFKRYFYERIAKDDEYLDAIRGLKGKTLGGWCAPKRACHGQVYAEYLENDNNG